MRIERQEGKRPLDDWTSHKHLVLRYQNWQNIMQYSSRTLNGFLSAEMSDQRQRPPLHQQDHQLLWAPPICTAQCPGSREQAAEFVATYTNPMKPATPQPPSVQPTFISPWSRNLPHPQHLLLMGHYSNELALPPLNSQPMYTEWWNQGVIFTMSCRIHSTHIFNTLSTSPSYQTHFFLSRSFSIYN